VQVIAACRLADYKPPTAVETTTHGVQTKDPSPCILAPHEFTQRILDYLRLANNTDEPDSDVEKLYAKTYAEHPHNAGLQCFPATITQFDPCHKAMWSAAYNAAVNLTVVCKRTLQLQVANALFNCRLAWNAAYTAHTRWQTLPSITQG
jgi:hypothetical protein